MADRTPGRDDGPKPWRHPMYIDVMARTQIYLGDDELTLLECAERQTGASRSELIRRAIRSSYAGMSSSERTAALEQTAGSWQGSRATGADDVDALRSDLDERLRGLGL
jgi:hypothetical protein